MGIIERELVTPGPSQEMQTLCKNNSNPNDPAKRECWSSHEDKGLAWTQHICGRAPPFLPQLSKALTNPGSRGWRSPDHAWSLGEALYITFTPPPQESEQQDRVQGRGQSGAAKLGLVLLCFLGFDAVPQQNGQRGLAWGLGTQGTWQGSRVE